MSDAALGSILPLAVACPLLGAVICPIAGRRSGSLALAIAAASLLGSCAVLGLEAPRVFGGRTIIVHFMGHWTPVHGHALGIGWAADPFGLVFAIAAALVGVVLVVYTMSAMAALGRGELGGFACLFLVLDAALIGAALTGDLFNLFVWFEVAAIASYALTAFYLDRPMALEAAFKILVLTTIASFAIFIGAGFLYQDHGALNFAQLHDSIAAHGLRTADVVALGLLVGGFATKAGLIPFHAWLPDAHTAAPAPVSAMFSGLMVNLGIVAIARLVLQVFPTQHGVPFLGLLMGMGLLSAVVGSALALGQDNLKRLLAYDTVAQMGVLAVGFATADKSGVAGAAYHLANHVAFKSLLFLTAGAIIHTLGVENLSEMGGLARRKPFLFAAFLLGVASIAGVPPLNGYSSRNLIHEGLISTHQLWALAVLAVAEILTFAALAKAAWLMFLQRRRDPYGEERASAAGMSISLLVLGVLCLAFGLVPGELSSKVMAPAAAGLLDAPVYARGVLHATAVQLPQLHVHSSFVSMEGILSTGITLVVGGLLASFVVRRGTPRPITLLRGFHTGSANDYAMYAVLGLVVGVAVLRLAWSG
ncbi:MAG: Fe-S-binding domain-containing protein [Actinobacteria bacterium]|nr:Fe-S-binding domain-containing protein [Actinomycetota bacterium]